MKNGCKKFISPTMDKLKIEPYYIKIVLTM